MKKNKLWSTLANFLKNGFLGVIWVLWPTCHLFLNEPAREKKKYIEAIVKKSGKLSITPVDEITKVGQKLAITPVAKKMTKINHIVKMEGSFDDDEGFDPVDYFNLEVGS